MALQKDVKTRQFLTLNYHRISSIEKVTNEKIIVRIESFMSEADREKEKAYREALAIHLENDTKLTDEQRTIFYRNDRAYSEEWSIEIPYDENITIEGVYNYLKEKDKKFMGATDI